MIYIAFLQGINVGKHNRIKMTDLKRMFESMGFKKVQTYLQNGNVIFESDKDEVYLRKSIEREIMIIYRYVVPVVLRTSKDLEEVILNCPYSKERICEAECATGEGLYVSLLKQVTSSKKLDDLNECIDKGDEYKIIGRDVYLLFFNNTIRYSKLSTNIIKLDVHATIRKFRTIKKLNKLVKK